MTLVSQIITDAFRQGNLVQTGAAPTADEATEGLRYLNRLVKSVFGNEAGEALIALPIGRHDIARPAGWPWWNTTPSGDWFVPKNARLMLNLEESTPLYLHPVPDDGTRFAVIDISSNLSTYPVTVYGNGRLIEGAASVVLNTDDLDAEWFYREDLANWLRYAPLEADDTFPFPEEFDDFFITLLAIRLNPSYGIALDPQSKAIFDRSRSQFRSRYSQHIPTRSEPALTRLSRLSAERDAWRDWDGYYDPTSAWNRGYPY